MNFEEKVFFADLVIPANRKKTPHEKSCPLTRLQISKFHLGIGWVGERFQKVKAFKIHYFVNSLFFFLSLSDGPSPCSSSSRFAIAFFHHNVGNTSLFLLHLFLPKPTDISWLDDNSFSFFTW